MLEETVIKFLHRTTRKQMPVAVRMRPLACLDCGFESSPGHGRLSVVNVVLSGRGL